MEKEVKTQIVESVQKHLKQAVKLSEELAAHPELPYEEFESSQKMAKLLSEEGFDFVKIS